MKKKVRLDRLSPGEQILMKFVWRLQPVSVAELLQAVNEDRPEPIIRNTLRTQLTRLEAKGWVVRDEDEEWVRYRATVEEQPGRRRVLAELKERFFGGSGLSMIRCLMEEGDLTADEIRELEKVIRSRKGGAK